MNSGWRMKEIDKMDMLGYLQAIHTAWKQETYTDEVWGSAKPSVLMKRLPDFQFFSPFWRFSIICPVFIQRDNAIIFNDHEANSMEKERLIRRINFYCYDVTVLYFFYPFNDPIPFAGIIAIHLDEFIHSELLVGAMPADNGIWRKISRQFFSLLIQNGLDEALKVYHLSLSFFILHAAPHHER